jgi:hypothetical protein
MPRFYKGMGVGTFHQTTDLRTIGINSWMPSSLYNVNTVMQHIARGTTTGPCVSLTRSYSVAEEYAIDASRAFPSSSTPVYVYEISIPAPPPTGVRVVDPVFMVASHHNNALASPSYHHDGDMNFFARSCRPHRNGYISFGMGTYLRSPIRAPKGSATTLRPANLSIELETFVRAMRDAEVLVLGAIPSMHVINRYDVF